MSSGRSQRRIYIYKAGNHSMHKHLVTQSKSWKMFFEERQRWSGIYFIENRVASHYPGGRVLASTTSPASFSSSSAPPSRGDRGKAIRPVRADSKMPKGDMSFRKASIRGGFAELHPMLAAIRAKRRVDLTFQQCSYWCLYPTPFRQIDASNA